MADLQDEAAAAARIATVPTILEIVCRMTGMGFAALARVTSDRWIAAKVLDKIGFGLADGAELPIGTTLCRQVRETGRPVTIDDAAQDPVYQGHHTPSLYGFASYISIPIRLESGEIFGTLCALDPQPAKVSTPEAVTMFEMFASMIASQLDAEKRLAQSEAALLTEREGAELREQFIAVLGHDLRNPLASIDAGVRMLRKTIGDDETQHAMLKLMHNSVWRMTGLIENVVDFARGRLGGGLAIQRDSSELLGPVLLQVAEELRIAHPDRIIDLTLDFEEPIACDRARLAQLLSNLIGNAIAHGSPDAPVTVKAWREGERFSICVANQGEPIPQDKMERLFQPFFRASERTHHEGLGLGLYIASQIAKGHGGTLEVGSTPEETRFTFSMPVA